jgi:hypothetical protein
MLRHFCQILRPSLLRNMCYVSPKFCLEMRCGLVYKNGYSIVCDNNYHFYGYYSLEIQNEKKRRTNTWLNVEVRKTVPKIILLIQLRDASLVKNI